MKNNYLKIIRDTLETNKNITILSMLDESISNEYGHEVIVVYINNIENSLSFLYKYEPSLHISIEDYNIHLIELGYLLKSIYHNPKSFLFVNFLNGQYDYMIPDDEDGDNYYSDIINLVKDNLPLLLVKGFISDEIDNLPNIDNVVSYMKEMDFSLLLNLCQYLIDNNIVDYDINFLKKYVGKKHSETTFIEIMDDLNNFKQKMDIELNPNKISEAFIRELDDLYVNTQIIYSAINND